MPEHCQSLPVSVAGLPAVAGRTMSPRSDGRRVRPACMAIGCRAMASDESSWRRPSALCWPCRHGRHGMPAIGAGHGQCWPWSAVLAPAVAINPVLLLPCWHGQRSIRLNVLAMVAGPISAARLSSAGADAMRASAGDGGRYDGRRHAGACKAMVCRTVASWRRRYRGLVRQVTCQNCGFLN